MMALHNKGAVTMKWFFSIICPACVLLLIGCAGHYSSVKPDSNQEGTAQIIVGSPQNISSALSDLIQENFIVYSYRLDADAGKLVFEGKGTAPLRGDVEVFLSLKQVTGKSDNGTIISGYSLDITSRGIGFNASMLPGYATDNIKEALVAKAGQYDLSFINVRSQSIETVNLPAQLPGMSIGQYEDSTTPTTSTTSEDAANSLRELKKLYDEKVIDQHEYETKKAEILQRM
jgi:hypothetical protein